MSSVEQLPAGRYDVSVVATEAVKLADEAPVRLAGRLMLWRPSGGLSFGHIQDRSGRVQIALRRDVLGPELYQKYTKAIRIGDFVGVSGRMWTTRRGERTVDVEELTLLNRTQRPLPDKWLGISNAEARARRRYLDLLVNEGSRQRFEIRAKVIRIIRSFLDERGFLEVETPILQAAASGAAARPFVTHHNANDEDLYLRISPETYLKRLTVGGLERVYEIGKNFRNEGVDASHLQEFTMLEWYAAYWDYRDNMATIRELIQTVLDEALGKRTVEYEGLQLDFDGEWPVLDFRELVQEATGVDLCQVRDLESLRSSLAGNSHGVDLSAPSYPALVDQLYKKTVRPRLIQPCFLVGHPAELVPLARRSDDDPTRLDMFQVVVNSWEVVKAYSELVDPTEQRKRLEEQAALRAAGDAETMMLEEDFIEAMEYGMPPMSGLGMGIDRLLSLLTDAGTLRDVVLFPSLRSQSGGPADGPEGNGPTEEE